MNKSELRGKTESAGVGGGQGQVTGDDYAQNMVYVHGLSQKTHYDIQSTCQKTMLNEKQMQSKMLKKIRKLGKGIQYLLLLLIVCCGRTTIWVP